MYSCFPQLLSNGMGFFSIIIVCFIISGHTVLQFSFLFVSHSRGYKKQRGLLTIFGKSIFAAIILASLLGVNSTIFAIFHDRLGTFSLICIILPSLGDSFNLICFKLISSEIVLINLINYHFSTSPRMIPEYPVLSSRYLKVFHLMKLFLGSQNL